MDDSVIQAMAKWPNVPDCYGWLHLNAQGQWLMGEHHPTIIEHEGLKGFIARNYLCPDHQTHPGAWALQNGPQRVWINLALAPYIVHLHGHQAYTHTMETCSIYRLVQSSDGVMYCMTDKGPGAIASSSMELFSNFVLDNHTAQTSDNNYKWEYTPENFAIPIEQCQEQHIASLLGFVRRPSL